MAQMINIGGDPNDRCYRYKMPRLEAKQEGRGNGAKTRIVNCADIASSLHRKPSVLCKFFGIDRGCQSTWTEKEEACIVTGHHEQKVLQDRLIEGFVPKFVLCPNCGLPETAMKIRKDSVKYECASCGWSGQADPTHKLVKFIINDDEKDKKSSSGGKKEKKERKKASEEGAEGEEAPDEKKEKKEKKKKKEKKESKEKKSKKDKKSKKEESDEEEWFTDISEAAVESRRIAEMEQMSAGAKAMLTTDELKAEEKAPEAKEESSDADSADGEAGGEADSLLQSLVAKIGDLKKSKEILPVADAWADALAGASPATSVIFAMLEQLPENLMKHSTIVLKALYDHEVVSETEIFEWHSTSTCSEAVSGTDKFIAFLKEE